MCRCAALYVPPNYLQDCSTLVIDQIHCDQLKMYRRCSCGTFIENNLPPLLPISHLYELGWCSSSSFNKSYASHVCACFIFIYLQYVRFYTPLIRHFNTVKGSASAHHVFKGSFFFIPALRFISTPR